MAKYTEQFKKEWERECVDAMTKWIVVDGGPTTKYVDYGPSFEERDYFLIEITLGDPDELEALANKVCALLNADHEKA